MKIARLQHYAIGYFALQGLSVLAWWLWLGLQPSARKLFLPPQADEHWLLAFALPDLLIVGIGGIAAALALGQKTSTANALTWLVTGGMIYAALYCLALSWLTDAAWLSVLLMLPTAALSLTFAAVVTHPAERFFRRAANHSATFNLTKTAGQIVIFWTFFLFCLPALFHHIERKLGWLSFSFTGHAVFAVLLFGLFSFLGLWSGFTMSRLGGGTPLPIDGTNQLVARGPYQFIRNPMVVAGLGQGFAVGLYRGSWLVLGYVIVGGILWNEIARPLEEIELQQKFGADYQRYCSEVKCWIPRLTK
ncbi:MAG: isoprenylcysteine carboxylmethyltransferase family protein [Acidobacteria bacterium]|nr:isoprenylcysteine carboxylmethyltransferase family protein [Acidobacteriota bacterium]